MKSLELQQQQLLISTPKQSKVKRSSTNSSPLTTTNSSSGIVSPTNSTTKIQEPQIKRNLSRQQQNENDYIQPPIKLKPISIVVQQTPQNNSITSVKSASPSPSPKANEIWLEYGCI
jgi:hypothetical protein